MTRSVRRTALFGGCLVVLALEAGSVRSAAAVESSPVAASSVAPKDPSPAERRPRPNYAPAPPPSGGDSWLWLPRVLLFPLYLLSEYGLRRPLQAGIRHAEQEYWPEHVIDFFTFGPNRQAGIIPVVFADLGFRARGGALFYWNRPGAVSNRFRLRADVGPGAWLVSASDRVGFEQGGALRLTGTVTHREDARFWGLGPLSDSSTRYSVDVAQMVLRFTQRGFRRSFWFVEAAARKRDVANLRQASSSGPQPFGGAVLEGQPAPPSLPGAHGNRVARIGAGVVFDNRRGRPPESNGVRDVALSSGTGLRLAAQSALAVDTSQPPGSVTASSWWDSEISALGAVDVAGAQRTLSVLLMARLVHPTETARAVPFLEQPTLGGNYPMPGLRTRRLTGESVVSARVQYRWPIWVYLDGVAGAALGNAFGSDFAGFAVRKLRASFDWGISTNESDASALQVLVGVGTSPLFQGARLDELRLVTSSVTRF